MGLLLPSDLHDDLEEVDLNRVAWPVDEQLVDLLALSLPLPKMRTHECQAYWDALSSQGPATAVLR